MRTLRRGWFYLTGGRKLSQTRQVFRMARFIHSIRLRAQIMDTLSRLRSRTAA